MGRSSKRKKKRGAGTSDGRRNKGRNRENVDEDDDFVAKQSVPQYGRLLHLILLICLQF